MSQLRELLREDTAGDPMGRRGLWTGLRLEQISARLNELGITVCPNTVRRLLDVLGYALHANRKSLSGPQSPERDCQFQYIRHQRQEFTQTSDHPCGHQEEGIGGRVQKCGPDLEPGGTPG